MVRIHVLGGPGSGKTTLAQELATCLHTPHYELDKMEYEGKEVALATQPAWVTEGVYLVATEPMLYHADWIVLLTIPWPVAAWRIVRRHIMNSLRGTQAYPGFNGIKLLFKLLVYARRYYRKKEHTSTSVLDEIQRFIEAHQAIATPPTEEFMRLYVEAYRAFIVPPGEVFVRGYLERYQEKVLLVRTVADRARLFARCRMIHEKSEGIR